MTWLWGLLAAARCSGPIASADRSTAFRSIVSRKRCSIAGVLPALWYLAPGVPSHVPRARRHPRCWSPGRSRRRCCSCRTAGACASSRRGPFARDAGRAPHAWDMRADWRSPEPACSAIMTRSYRDLRGFPGVVLQPAAATATAGRSPADRPPDATVAMQRSRIPGRARRPVSLQIDTGPDVSADR